MSAEIIVVTAAYGQQQIVAAGGQRALLPTIAAAGADGVEIRRELLTPDELAMLPALPQSINRAGLFACYSAPIPLCTPDGALTSCLPGLLAETARLGARWLKLPLGHFHQNTVLTALPALLARYDVGLTIENDQSRSGRLAVMQSFQAARQRLGLPVTLTFDMGNWLWVGDHPAQAATTLASDVSYVHIKAAVAAGSGYRAVALDEAPPSWRTLLRQLPASAPRGIEFPLEGDDLVAVTRHYVNLLREEQHHG